MGSKQSGPGVIVEISRKTLLETSQTETGSFSQNLSKSSSEKVVDKYSFTITQSCTSRLTRLSRLREEPKAKSHIDTERVTHKPA